MGPSQKYLQLVSTPLQLTPRLFRPDRRRLNRPLRSSCSVALSAERKYLFRDPLDEVFRLEPT